MLIPSIDLMGGKIVQLIQGKQKALEFENFTDWVARFSGHPLVQLIDLDAAMGKGSNPALVADICGKLPCQVGGGMRSEDDVRVVLDVGARKAIVGSSLITNGTIDVAFAERLSKRFDARRLVFAIDSCGGHVAIHGWNTVTDITPSEMIRVLEPFCSAFLYTHIDTEGLLKGIPVEVVRHLRGKTRHPFLAAGGIRSREEVDQLDALGVDAVVGMAIYLGVLEV